MSTATTIAPPPPSPTRVKASPRILRAELLKIWTTHAWWIIGLIMLAFTALALLATVSQTAFELQNAQHNLANPPQFGAPPGEPQMSPEDLQRAQKDYLDSINIPQILIRSAASIYTSGQFIGLLLMVILGALIVTNEFQHQTATTTFLTVPRRSRVILAKLGAAITLAFAFWLVVTVIDVAVGSLYFNINGYDISLTQWPVLRSVLFNLLAFVMWAVMGVGLGVLIRSQLASTILGVVFYVASYAAIAVFALVRTFLIKDDVVWKGVVAVPGLASAIMVSPERLEFGDGAFAPPWWVGALVLVGYGIVFAGVGTLITRKRDIS